MKEYRICTRCVMDTTDPEIVFDEKGVCNHCLDFDRKSVNNWFPNDKGRAILNKVVEDIKKYSKHREYDCIIGLSGGVDSSYLAYLARKEFDLRLLAVHVDAGWNSEIAVKNIENIVKKLNIDLYTHVVDWEEMKDLQVSYFKSGLANQDVPQDHIFFSILYNYAHKNKIKYVLHGGNYVTECVLPKSWGYNPMDAKQLETIHKLFGKHKLRDYKTVSFFKYYFYYPHILNMKVVKMLNCVPYDKDQAISILEKELGWRYYGGKHHESRFTKFFQSYFLPTRFGFDKRRAHFSSQIVTGQKTRAWAIEELKKSSYSEKELSEDINFIIKKLDLTMEEYIKFMNMPLKTFKDYKSNYRLFVFLTKLQSFLKSILKKVLLFD